MKYLPMPKNPIEKSFRKFLENQKTAAPLDRVKALAELEKFKELLGGARFEEILNEEGSYSSMVLQDFVSVIVNYFSGLGELMNGVEMIKVDLDKLVQPVQEQSVGTLLLAHLRLEYVMDQVINDNFKVNGNSTWLDSARLSFWQKIQMLPLNSQWAEFAVKILKEINRLRNAYAHDIRFDLNNFKSDLFEELWTKQNSVTSEEKMKQVLNLIWICEFLLLIQTSRYKLQVEEIVDHYPNLKKIAFGNSEREGRTIYDFIKGI